MVFPEQLCGRPKAQPVQTETGGKRPAEKFGAGFIIQTLQLGK